MSLKDQMNNVFKEASEDSRKNLGVYNAKKDDITPSDAHTICKDILSEAFPGYTVTEEGDVDKHDVILRVQGIFSGDIDDTDDYLQVNLDPQGYASIIVGVKDSDARRFLGICNTHYRGDKRPLNFEYTEIMGGCSVAADFKLRGGLLAGKSGKDHFKQLVRMIGRFSQAQKRKDHKQQPIQHHPV